MAAGPGAVAPGASLDEVDEHIRHLMSQSSPPRKWLLTGDDELLAMASVARRANYSHCARILREARTHRASDAFEDPIDLEMFPDYASVVGEPLCLRQVRDELDEGLHARGVIRTAGDFARRMNQIWENCWRYNGPDSYLREYALYIMQDTRAAWDQWGDKFLRSDDPEAPFCFNCGFARTNRGEVYQCNQCGRYLHAKCGGPPASGRYIPESVLSSWACEFCDPARSTVLLSESEQAEMQAASKKAASASSSGVLEDLEEEEEEEMDEEEEEEVDLEDLEEDDEFGASSSRRKSNRSKGGKKASAGSKRRRPDGWHGPLPLAVSEDKLLTPAKWREMDSTSQRKVVEEAVLAAKAQMDHDPTLAMWPTGPWSPRGRNPMALQEDWAQLVAQHEAAWESARSGRPMLPLSFTEARALQLSDLLGYRMALSTTAHCVRDRIKHIRRSLERQKLELREVTPEEALRALHGEAADEYLAAARTAGRIPPGPYSRVPEGEVRPSKAEARYQSHKAQSRSAAASSASSSTDLGPRHHHRHHHHHHQSHTNHPQRAAALPPASPRPVTLPSILPPSRGFSPTPVASLPSDATNVDAAEFLTEELERLHTQIPEGPTLEPPKAKRPRKATQSSSSATATITNNASGSSDVPQEVLDLHAAVRTLAQSDAPDTPVCGLEHAQRIFQAPELVSAGEAAASVASTYWRRGSGSCARCRPWPALLRRTTNTAFAPIFPSAGLVSSSSPQGKVHMQRSNVRLSMSVPSDLKPGFFDGDAQDTVGQALRRRNERCGAIVAWHAASVTRETTDRPLVLGGSYTDSDIQRLQVERTRLDTQWGGWSRSSSEVVDLIRSASRDQGKHAASSSSSSASAAATATAAAAAAATSAAAAAAAATSGNDGDEEAIAASLPRRRAASKRVETVAYDATDDPDESGPSPQLFGRVNVRTVGMEMWTRYLGLHGVGSMAWSARVRPQTRTHAAAIAAATTRGGRPKDTLSRLLASAAVEAADADDAAAVIRHIREAVDDAGAAALRAFVDGWLKHGRGGSSQNGLGASLLAPLAQLQQTASEDIVNNIVLEAIRDALQ